MMWTWTWTLWSILCLLLFRYMLKTIYTYRRLAAHPGPTLNAISYWPMFLNRLAGSENARIRYEALSTQYGKLVRIGPNDLLTSDAELIARMSAPKSTYKRSSWYAATRLDPYHDMMGSVTDSATHAAIKSKTAPGYRGADIPRFEESLGEGITAFFALIRRKYLSDDTEYHSFVVEKNHKASVTIVDLGRLLELYAMDARSRMSFNEPVGALEHDEDIFSLVKTATLALSIIQLFTDIPFLQSIATNNFILGLLGPKPTDSSGYGKIMGIAQDHVDARIASGAGDKQDLLDSFLARGLDPRSAAAELVFPMVAGSDTAAKALKWTVTLILSHPHVYEKLVLEAKNCESSTSTLLTYEITRQIPYLRAVILESLRMRPPFTGLLMKQTGPDGDVYQGKFIPPGTRVGHDTWSLTHDRSVFGNDADVFRPERWLEADATQEMIMTKQTELVFGTGRWQCPGKAVAFMELHKFVMGLIRNFHIHLVDSGPSVVITERNRIA